MKNYLKSVIDRYGLIVKNNNDMNCICEYLETLIFNIVSIASLITLINNSKVIEKEALKLVHSYINDKCEKVVIKGGTSLPSEYFGVDSHLYNSSNNQADVLNIDYINGILRPQIGGGGNSRNSNKKSNHDWLKAKIIKLIQHYNLTIKEKEMNYLINIIYDNVNCLFFQIPKNQVITKSYLNKFIKSNKSLAIFN